MEKFKDLFEEKRFRELMEYLNDMNEVDLAEYLKELDKNQKIIFFRLLKKDNAAEVFSYMDTEEQLDLIDSITEARLKELMENMAFDDKIDLLEEMPAKVVKKILQHVTKDERKIINHFLNFPEDSAGSIMTIEYVDLKKYFTVKDALEHIKKTGVNKETIYTCYVIDSSRHLEGTISLKDIIMAKEDSEIGELMDNRVVAVQTTDDQEEVAALFKKYDLLSVPVIDRENRLVGIITIDDIIDVIEEEDTEDFHKMAAMEANEVSYLKTGIVTLARKRILWLMALMISATLTAKIVQHFDMVLQSVVSLAYFIPMLMGTGGNAGSQSATLVIRGMAVGELDSKDAIKVISKELRVSFLVGLALATVNYIRIILFENLDTGIALTVSLTIMVTVMLAKLTGAMLPIIAKAVKVDPAIIAAPMISTIVDALTLIMYFNIARIILGRAFGLA